MGTRGVGARWGPAPAPGERGGWEEAFPPTPDERPKPDRGAPSRAGLTERGGGRAEARAGPLGAPHLRDVMFVPPAGSATDRLLAQAPLGPATIGMARGRPARDRTGGRASRPRADPPPGLGIPETVQPPPKPSSLLLFPRPSPRALS